MGRRVRIASGYPRVVLTDGHMYGAGDETVLSNFEWEKIHTDAIGSVLIDLGAAAHAEDGSGGGGSEYVVEQTTSPTVDPGVMWLHPSKTVNGVAGVPTLHVASGASWVEALWQVDGAWGDAPPGSITDTFNRTGVFDGSLTSDGKVTWAYLPTTAFTVSNTGETDGVYLRNDQQGTFLYTIPTGWSDVEVTLSLQQAASWNGVLLRAQDANNFIQAGVNFGTDQAWFDVYVDGAHDAGLSAGGGAVTVEPPLIMTVRAVGPDLQILVDGVVVQTHTLTTFQTVTTHGVFLRSLSTAVSALADEIAFAPAA